MIVNRRLRLLSPLLAIKMEPNGGQKRIFRKLSAPPDGEPAERVYILSDLARWEWAFLEARDALEMEDVAVSAIKPFRWFATKRTVIHNRQRRRGNRMWTDKFESISAGHVIEIKFTLSKHIPPNTDGCGRFTRPPDEAEFDEMLRHIGQVLGMSEWGHAHDYGRFELRPSDDSDEGDPKLPQGDNQTTHDTLQDLEEAP